MEKNERKAKRKLRKVKELTVLAVIAILGIVVIFGLKSPAFNVAEVQVSGNHYYTDDEIINMADCTEGANIFTGIDCSDIRERLMKDPYMSQVKVKRKLPHTIEIDINERRQIAGVVYGTSYVVIDAEGTVLRKTSVDPKVTVLRGMDIAKMTLGEPIEIEQEVLFRQCMNIIDAMKENDMYFKAIEIEEGNVKAYVLDSLIVDGTSENIVLALKNNDIQLVVQNLFDQGIERGTIKVNGDSYIPFTPKID